MILKIQKHHIPLLVASFVVCASLLALFLFPVHSGKTCWTGYRVLVVTPANKEAEVVSRLDKAGITDYASEANSQLANSSPEAPIQPYLSRLNDERSRWFTDDEHNTRFVYLKNLPFLDNRIEKAFTGSDLAYYLEKNSGMLFAQSLALILLLCVGLFTRSNRAYQFFCAIPSFMLSVYYCQIPGFLASVALLWGTLELAGSVDTQRLLLNSRQLLNILIRKRMYALFFLVALVFGALRGFHGFFLVFLAILASAALPIPVSKLVEIYRKSRNRKRLHPRFEPLAISGGSVLPVNVTNLKYALPLAALLTAGIGIPLLVMRSPSHKTDESRVLYIPAPSRYTRHAGFGVDGYSELTALRSKQALPDLGDFVAARWIIRTAPWRRIQDPVLAPEAESTAEYVSYQMDEAGIITGKKRIMDTFNTGFIKKSLVVDSTRLEKMLLKQKRFVTVELTRLN